MVTLSANKPAVIFYEASELVNQLLQHLLVSKIHNPRITAEYLAGTFAITQVNGYHQLAIEQFQSHSSFTMYVSLSDVVREVVESIQMDFPGKTRNLEEEKELIEILMEVMTPLHAYLDNIKESIISAIAKTRTAYWSHLYTNGWIVIRQVDYVE